MSMILSSILLKAVFAFILLLLTVFFTASETSLTVLRRSQIKRLIAEKKHKGLELWLKDPNRLLTTTLVGTAVSVIGISVLGTTTALDLSALYNFSPVAATSLTTLIVVIMVLVFAEIVPKAYARRNARKVSAIIIEPLRYIDLLIMPLVKFFTIIANFFIKIFGGKSLKQQPLFAFEEVKGLIEMGVKEGVLAKAEKKMLSQIMEFGDTIVREVMVPRVDVKALDIEDEASVLIDKALRLRHSRIPVYRENIDNIIGLLYVKDLLPVLASNETDNVRQLLRKPYFVPETMRIGTLLKEFRQGREHIAVVVDEYGVLAGLVTIEDIVEEITGEIFDEYDIRKERIKKIDEKTWEINAKEDLDKINDDLGLNLPEDQYDSLGGLIMGELGRMPKEGEEFEFMGIKIKVLSATPSKVIKARLKI